jgi:glycosyltransferase involved in cell wall biosynthesis
MDIEVSICIPAYNNLTALKRCLESIFIQTYTNYEIVITDDSTNFDIRDYFVSKIHPKIKYFKNEMRLGSPENWNNAIRKSSANLIKLMHHDDWFTDKDSLRIFIELMSNKETSLGFVSSINYDLHSMQIVGINRPIRKVVSDINSNPILLMLGNWIGSPSATIFRKSDLIFDSMLIWLVDIDYYIRLIEGKKNINYCDKTAITIGISDSQITKKVISDKALNIFEFFYLLEKFSVLKIYNSKFKTATLNLIEKFDLKSVADIQLYYSGKLPKDINKYFSISHYISKSISKKCATFFIRLNYVKNKIRF